jgi:alcohol dehydrogenase
MPTTAGTGSEMSSGIAIRVDEFSSTKRLVATPFNHPEVVIVDPSLTISMPRVLTANTGVDALAHAIESFIALKHHPLTDVLAPEAIRLVTHNLPVAYAKGSDVEARFNMSLAATIAGICLGGGVTSVHYLAGLFDSKYGLPHGRAVAIMLAHMMPYFMAGNPEKFARIAQIMGENIEGLPVLEAAAKSVTAVKRLLGILNISINLTDYGAVPDDLNELVQLSLERPARLLDNDPADITEDDFKAIYSAALGI